LDRGRISFRWIRNMFHFIVPENKITICCFKKRYFSGNQKHVSTKWITMFHETLKDGLQKACCSYKQTNFWTDSGSCFDLKHGSPMAICCMFRMFRKLVSVLDEKSNKTNSEYVIQNHVPDSPKRNAPQGRYHFSRSHPKYKGFEICWGKQFFFKYLALESWMMYVVC
jgi:hypothetical protein